MEAVSHVDDIWSQLAQLHPRLCPRQVLGVRIGQYAGELLRVRLPRMDRRLMVFVETDGCFADGVAVATGCWLGHRTLRLVDHGKVAATCVDVRAGRAVRIWPQPRARMLADQLFPGAATRWQAQLKGYQSIAPEELLCAEEVMLTTSLGALLGQPGGRSACGGCGEEILNQRAVSRGGAKLCSSCAGVSYFTYLGARLQVAKRGIA